MTLYFETDKADGFREPGFSKERRLEPQITVGLLTDETGFPLRAGAFEGNKAETATMIPMINDFMNAYNLDDVVVVADAGMISARSVRLIDDGCNKLLLVDLFRLTNINLPCYAKPIYKLPISIAPFGDF